MWVCKGWLLGDRVRYVAALSYYRYCVGKANVCYSEAWPTLLAKDHHKPVTVLLQLSDMSLTAAGLERATGEALQLPSNCPLVQRFALREVRYPPPWHVAARVLRAHYTDSPPKRKEPLSPQKWPKALRGSTRSTCAAPQPKNN